MTVWCEGSPNPFETGTITSLALDGTDQPPGTAGATAGLANAEEAAEVGLEDGAFLSVMRLEADFSIEGFTVWLPVDLLSAGTELTIGEDRVGGVQWTMSPGAAAPETYVPIVAGTLELAAAGTEPGAVISGRLSGAPPRPALRIEPPRPGSSRASTVLSSVTMTDTWTWELIARHEVITEGPAWDGDGLRYTEIDANRLWRYTPADGRREVWRESTGGANGTIFDAAGRYYACEGKARRVVRYAAGKPTDVIADAHAGAPFNEPNDLAVDAAGRVWFSDPNYGERPLAQARESVYRCDPSASGWTITEVTTDTNRPNGVLLSADQSTLYVAESPRRLDQRRQLRAYPIQADGSLGDYTLLHDFGAGRGVDGMCRAAGGLIVATAGHQERGPGPAIYVFDATGLPLSTHRTPADRPTNCTFGGADLTDLYVTFFGGELYRVADSGLRAEG